MNGGRWAVTLGFTALQLTGCSIAPTVEVEDWRLGSAREAFAAEREILARDYESNGSLRLALNEWLAISAVLPEDPEPQAQIERLGQAISMKAAGHRRAAASALAKRDYARARLYSLRILALQPDNREAIQTLKKLEARSGYARLASEPRILGDVVQAYEAPTPNSNRGVETEVVEPGQASVSVRSMQATTASPSAGGSGGEDNLELALRYLSEKRYDAALARFLLARQHKEASDEVLNQHIAYLRRVLAERHYHNGVNAFRTASYDLAVAEFKKALEYDPEHQKARLYLGSASEMQLRLAPSP